MAGPQLRRQCAASRGRKRARGFPLDRLGPPSDDPELEARQLSISHEPVDFFVNVEAFERIVRPMVRDDAQRFVRVPTVLPDRMKDRSIRPIVDDRVRPLHIEPARGVVFPQPLRNEDGKVDMTRWPPRAVGP